MKTEALYNTVKKPAQRALRSIYVLTITRDVESKKSSEQWPCS